MSKHSQGAVGSKTIEVNSDSEHSIERELAETKSQLVATAAREYQHAETIEQLRARARELEAALEQSNKELEAYSKLDRTSQDSTRDRESDAGEGVSSLKASLWEVEEAGKETISRFRRQLVVASYAQAEHQLRSSRFALASVNSQYLFYRMQIMLLMQFIEGFHKEVSLLFHSTQWKVGDRLARALKKTVRRSPQSRAEINYGKSYVQYNQWKRGFESRHKAQILNGILKEPDDFTSPVQATNRVRKIEGFTVVLRQETGAAKQDVQYLMKQYVDLENHFKMIRKSLHFRLGLILVRQLVRFRRDPNNALYLVLLESRSQHFKNWHASYTAAAADKTLEV